ncbi:TIR domain-containing protein [Sorangium sp. So ce117]|uniref:toll/interleukin-1 receptor domain-containing protein n=1 Tax=Sorangium sp. So ce117 TaxID=3133277 RepID=UPI003F60A4D7
MPPPIDVFFSYSHKDESLRDELEAHLAALMRRGEIRGWHHRKIEAGDDAQAAINEHVDAAHVILLLVSADFLASDDCHELVVKRALARRRAGEAEVIPIIVRECAWQEAPFAALAALPRNGKAVTSWQVRDEAWKDIVLGLQAALRHGPRRERPPVTSEGASPAAPLRVAPKLGDDELEPPRDNPFQKRGALSPEKRSYVERTCDHELGSALDRYPLIVINGAYGMGKSSLLVRTREQLRRSRNTCHLDLQAFRTDDVNAFYKRFFELIQRQIGKANDWMGLADVATRRPIALLLDELGHLTPDVARLFVPSLHHLAMMDEQSVRVVVCLPCSIDEFLAARGLDNPKHQDGWLAIQVVPLSDAEIDRLLSLLPLPAQRVARAHRSEIIRISNRHPRAVQCICHELFEAAQAGLPSEALLARLGDKRCYG